MDRPADISLRNWQSVAFWCAIGNVAAILASLVFNAVLFRDAGPDAFIRAMIAGIFVPIVIGLPMFAFFIVKLREMQLANGKLRHAASTDGLTGCLTRTAFTKVVNLFMEHPMEHRRSHGALLIVDADHFRSINDSWGHNLGDEALTIIARALKGSLRSGDSIGRLGGEEFGIFLPDVDEATARLIAERLRQTVSLAAFAPDGQLRQLSVSVGGIVFEQDYDFHHLFRLADERLFEAKKRGRNHVDIALASGIERIRNLAASGIGLRHQTQ